MAFNLYNNWTYSLWFKTIYNKFQGRFHKGEVDQMIEHLKKNEDCCEEYNSMGELLDHLAVMIQLNRISKQSKVQ